MLLIFGNSGKNEDFKPQNEFKLEPWVSIHIGSLDLSINKAVLYLVLASVLTIVDDGLDRAPHDAEAEPGPDRGRGRLRPDQKHDHRRQPRRQDGGRWFPFLAALFFWIWFSNMIGFLPLPTNTEHTVNVFGAEIPAFAIYAATANISIPLALTLVVWVSYHVEGIRAKGLVAYLAGWLPPGLEDMNPVGKASIFVIEAMSHFARLISLSVRPMENEGAGQQSNPWASRLPLLKIPKVVWGVLCRVRTNLQKYRRRL